jgi:outer membrane usher protein FimD/PapC
MPSRAFRRRLDDTDLEWLRVQFTTERGRVTAFTVQYETLVDGQAKAVARYDTAHGFPHLDIIDRRGRVVAKTPLAEHLSLGAALTHAEQEMQASWRRYREAFFKDRR